MTPEERRALEALQDLPDENEHDMDDDFEEMNLDSVLDGSAALDISHGGGEFAELKKALKANLTKQPEYVMP